MKKLLLILLTVPALFAAASCNKNSSLGGEQDSKGEIGTSFKGDFAGASNVNLSVTELKNGVSTVEGTFTMKDSRYMKVIKEHPEYFDVDGDEVTVHGIKYRATSEGIENLSGGDFDGVLVKYDAKVGDKYNSGGTVTHVSETNDFQWGAMKIKVIKVEHPTKRGGDAEKISYWANHRFGIVAVETEFTDGSRDFATISIF